MKISCVSNEKMPQLYFVSLYSNMLFCYETNMPKSVMCFFGTPTNVRTTNVRKDKRQNDKRQKGQTSEATNVRKDKRQKRQTSETTNVRRDKRQKDKRRKNVGKNVRKTSENHNIIYTINILIF